MSAATPASAPDEGEEEVPEAAGAVPKVQRRDVAPRSRASSISSAVSTVSAASTASSADDRSARAERERFEAEYAALDSPVWPPPSSVCYNRMTKEAAAAIVKSLETEAFDMPFLPRFFLRCAGIGNFRIHLDSVHSTYKEWQVFWDRLLTNYISIVIPA